jgi:hypothetical protein
LRFAQTAITSIALGAPEAFQMCTPQQAVVGVGTVSGDGRSEVVLEAAADLRTAAEHLGPGETVRFGEPASGRGERGG